MDEQEYKVVRQLDEVMPRALRSQKAGVSFDVRVYFRENDDGYRWAEVAFLDRDADHAIIDHMPLVGDGVVSSFFGQIEERIPAGWRAGAIRLIGAPCCGFASQLGTLLRRPSA